MLEQLICDKVGHSLQVFKAQELCLLFGTPFISSLTGEPYSPVSNSRPSSITTFVKDETSTKPLSSRQPLRPIILC